jgi:putative DNA primase/helicase
MATAANPTTSTTASGRARIDRKQVLDKLDLEAEFRSLGIKFSSSKPNDKGWLECHAWDRVDDNPSAGCNVRTGIYKDQASDEKGYSIFDLAHRVGKYPSAKDALRHYALKTRVIAEGGGVRPKGWTSFEAALSALLKMEQGIHGGTWSYRWANGSEAFRVVRVNFVRDGKAGKTIRPFHLTDEARWKQGQISGQRPLYLLPEILASNRPVWITEGEKCADALAAIGYTATTSANGAQSPQKTDWSPLRGRLILINPDNDEPGEDYAKTVAALIRSVDADAKIKVVRLPGLGDGEDVFDWIQKQPTKNPRDLWDQLDRFAAEAPLLQAKPEDLDRALAIIPQTDLGNAERLVARHGQDLRYCHVWSKWLHWSGRHWSIDRVAEVRRLAKDAVRRILAEAMKVEDIDARKRLATWAVESEERRKLSAMLHLAEAEKGIPILPEEMDSDPWLFNVRNGTLDLRTGELKAHNRSDLITKLCNIDFDPAARCPLWESTLAKFFAREDPAVTADLIAYFQRLCGYALTGVIRDHIMPIAFGKGSNGKSTILGTLLDVFGSDYAMKCPPDLLMSKKTDSHPTDRADLFGRRLVVAIETESGRRLNESLIKELTGGDRIRARRMREDFWEYSPTHTLFLATNHKPVIRGRDEGIWRRLKLIPFTVTVQGQHADTDMPRKLRNEFPGILAWCVRGCLEWQKIGLDAPDVVQDVTREYRREQDSLGAFLEEHTIRAPSLKAKASDLYGRYKTWAEAANEHVMSETMFSMTLAEDTGIEKKRSNGSWYIGIGLKDMGPKPPF